MVNASLHGGGADMRPLPLAVGVLTMLAFAAIIGLAAYGELLVRDVPFLFLHTDFLAKVVIFLSLAVVVWIALAPNRLHLTSRRLNSMALLVAGLGLLVTVLLFNNPRLICVDETKVDMLKIMGPCHAQSLMPLAFGLLAATVATARAGRRPA